MFRKIWVLALGLALVSAVAMAQDKKDVQPSSFDTYPNCGVPGNVVANCGFESGDFGSWSLSGCSGLTTVTTFAAHHYGQPFFSNQGVSTGEVGSDCCISQNVNTPAFFYDISIWLTNVGSPNHVSLSWNGSALTNVNNLFNFGWTQIASNSNFTAPAVSTLQMCFRNDPSFIYLDDIVVIQTPGTNAGTK